MRLHTYFYLSKKRINRKGECPIYCRISLNAANRTDFSTRIFLRVDEWDSKRAFPKGNARYSATRLSEIQRLVYEKISELEKKGIFEPSAVILACRQAQSTISTIREAMAAMAKAEKTAASSIAKLDIVCGQFEKETGLKSLAQVDESSLKEFAGAIALKFTANTAQKKMRLIKRIFNYAAGKGIILRNPFSAFKIPKGSSAPPVQLTLEEIQRIKDKELHCPRLNQVRDMFLMQCYTGLAYVDLKKFNREMISEYKEHKVLRGTRAKTTQPFLVPFFVTAEAIADKYNYALPVLSNQKYNAYLKEIADLCRIEKRLTTHVGRRTFSQIMIDAGYSAESVSYMMGHASFSMTQRHYGRIGEQRIVNEMMKLAG